MEEAEKIEGEKSIMGLIVQKFGGTSVANAERMQNVANIVTDTYQKGNDVIVVVSAQGDTTDALIEKAAQMNDRPSRREMDVLLSTGEQISIALLAMAIEKLGFPVISLTGWQAGVLTNTDYGMARVKRVQTQRIAKELDKRRIVIVAGFQGNNLFSDITTLGRGGSDTTAVALAAAFHADCCQIYTDVDGVYTADPRIVKNAWKLDEISFDEMLELASLGAQVLHNRSVEMAKKYNVNLEVLSSLEKKPGTKVKERVKMEKMLVRGVAKDDDVARIAIIGIPDKPGFAFKLFSLMSKCKINVDIILQSIGRGNTKDISFTVPRGQMEQTKQIIEENLDLLGAQGVRVSADVSKVSIVGAGMQSNPGVASKMFEALYEANININMISTSEIKISVLIDEKDSTRAVNVIHEAFLA